MTVRRAAVLGSPVAHSLSPVLHSAAYRELGLADWTFDRIEANSTSDCSLRSSGINATPAAAAAPGPRGAYGLPPSAILPPVAG